MLWKDDDEEDDLLADSPRGKVQADPQDGGVVGGIVTGTSNKETQPDPRDDERGEDLATGTP